MAVRGVASNQLSLITASAQFFGTGADGNVTLTSGTTTLVRDMHYANLTISGTGNINTGGYVIYVSGVLDLSAAPAAAILYNGTNGNAASGATAGAVASGLFGYTVPGVRNGSAGAAGGTGAGVQGSLISAQNNAYITTNRGSGPGGAGANAGGAAGAVVNIGRGPAVAPGPAVNPNQYIQQPSSAVSAPWAGLCGPGGSSGGGDGVNSGGGGGGGGTAGGYVAVRAAVIFRGTNTTASIIQAIGGNGGAGGTVTVGNVGGGGGGGGGTGGVIDLVVGQFTGSTITNALNVSGGTGGDGGDGAGTGFGGGGGGGGDGGAIKILTLLPTTTLFYNTEAIPGTANTAASGTTTGVAGSAGATSQANL